jgi:hypothetical protein
MSSLDMVCGAMRHAAISRAGRSVSILRNLMVVSCPYATQRVLTVGYSIMYKQMCQALRTNSLFLRPKGGD